MELLKMDYLPNNLDILCEQAARQELDSRAFLTEALASGKTWHHLSTPSSEMSIALPASTG